MGYLIIRNRRGGKDSWHVDGCSVGERTARQREADGWGYLVERVDTAERFNHRISQTCARCNSDGAIIAERYARRAH